ncbi:MAG: hypothetical protein U9R57_02760 [Thermodesulfobacteriota bacterium]|nr:hypothetical protein [Thermodesulfobacteriota bacterium]
MEKLIVEIARTPLPTILVMAGILFLFLAVVGKLGAWIVVSPQKQKLAGVLGSLLLIAGVILYIQRSSAPALPSVVTPAPGTSSINTLKDQIRAIDLQMQQIEEELTAIPLPRALLYELEHFRQEHEEHLSYIENRLTRFSLELEELHSHRSVDPGVRESIQAMANETIPDLETEKRAVQQQMEELQEEIREAQKRVELEKGIHELEMRKENLQEEINRSGHW